MKFSFFLEHNYANTSLSENIDVNDKVIVLNENEIQDISNTVKDDLVDLSENQDKPTNSDETDPTMISKLHVCPYCRGKFISLEEAQAHIKSFHQMSEENQSRLNLEIGNLHFK